MKYLLILCFLHVYASARLRICQSKTGRVEQPKKWTKVGRPSGQASYNGGRTRFARDAVNRRWTMTNAPATRGGRTGEWWRVRAEAMSEGLIHLKRIYNFWCSMLVYTPFALCFVTLRGVFYAFYRTNLLTRCHSASSLFLLFLCFIKAT
jgi:hypothetical protein